jgi:hypothetical protein
MFPGRGYPPAGRGRIVHNGRSINVREAARLAEAAEAARLAEAAEAARLAEAAEATTRQTGVTFTIGQDVGPLDFIARSGNFKPFVPNAEKEKADSLKFQAEFQARRNSRNDEARHNDLLEYSLNNYKMLDFEGGQRKKKKYKQTQTRQKKQHRRRRRRHSTRKYKK